MKGGIKFRRAGIFKPLDNYNDLRRVVGATTRGIFMYYRDHIIRMMVLLLGYAIATNMYFQALNNNFIKQRVDLNDPILKVYFPIVEQARQIDIINESLLIHSISRSLDLQISSTNREGFINNYTEPYMLLANNSELSDHWLYISKCIISRNVLTRLEDIICNYKGHLYRSDAPRFRSNLLDSETYSTAAKIQRKKILSKTDRDSETNLGKKNETLIKMLIPSALSKDADDYNALEQKYDKLISTIREQLKIALDYRKVNLTEEEITVLSEYLTIMLFKTLYKNIEDDVTDFEIERLQSASMAAPILYDFRLRKSKILYLTIDELTKVYGVLKGVIKNLSAVQDVDNLKQFGSVISKEVQGHNYLQLVYRNTNTVVSIFNLTGRAPKHNILRDLKVLLILLSAQPDHNVTLFNSNAYRTQLLNKLNKYLNLKNSYDSDKKIHFYTELGLRFLVVNSILVIPAILNMVRYDYGKYIFLATTHEAWIGISVVISSLLALFSNILVYYFIVMCYTSSILGFDRKYKLIIDLYTPIIVPLVYNNLKKAFLQQIYFFLINLSIMYLVDEMTYMSMQLYLRYIFFMLDGFAITVNNIILYTFNGRIIPIKGVIAGLYHKILNSYTVDTMKLIIATEYSVNEGTKYIFNESLINSTTLWYSLCLYAIPYLLYVLFIFMYLKVKLWNFPKTPEEYVPA
jgi:hypothetical protein